MNDFSSTFIETTAWLSQNAINLLLQSTVLILCGLLVARLLRGYGSAVQSAIYRATLVAVLACPLMALLLDQAGIDGWALQLPEATRNSVVAENHESPNLSSRDPLHNGQTLADSLSPELDVGQKESGFAGTPESIPAAGNSSAAERASLVPPAISKTIPNKTWITVYSLVSLVWLIGAGWLLVRLFLSWKKMMAIRNLSPRASESEQGLCRQLADRFDVRPPEVRRNSLISSPCLTGLTSPSILMPSEITQPVLLEKAFTHELAHLRRCDTAWNLIQRIAMALFFYQPLMWRLVSRLDATAEEVCDDYVVRHCEDRKGYAEQLVALAESNLLVPGIAGPCMFRSNRSLLGHRVTRILDTTRKLTTQISLPAVIGISILTLGSATLGGFLGNHTRPVDSDRISGDTHSALDPTPTADGRQEFEDGITLKGIVIDLHGVPVADATVNHRGNKTLSKADGSFRIRIRQQELDELTGKIRFAIWKQGYGHSVAHANTNTDAPLTLTLVNDDHPVEGQLIDTEGNPVAGATIQVETVTGFEKGVMEAALARAVQKNQAPEFGQGVILGDAKIPPVTSDDNGQFVIQGIGSGRLVSLLITSDTTAIRRAVVATSDTGNVSNPSPAYVSGIGDGLIHNRRPILTCEPTQPVDGIVVDQETRKPLAGFTVTSWSFPTQTWGRMVGETNLKTVTDKDGKFRLTGLPRGDGNQIIVTAPATGADAQPYLARVVEVPDATGLDPVQVDIGLVLGVWIQGRVTDEATGNPVVDARIQYMPTEANETAKQQYEMIETGQFIPHGYGFPTDSGGHYRFAGFPGPAVVAAWVVMDPGYPGGQGMDEIPDHQKTEDGSRIQARFYRGIGRQVTALKSVEIPAEGTDVSFSLSRGKTVRFRAADSQGNPVTGVRVTYSGLVRNVNRQTAAEFDLDGFLPGKPRTIILYHPEKQLGAFVTVDGDLAQQDVTLQPLGKVSAKLVDGTGQVISSAKLRINRLGNDGRVVSEALPDTPETMRDDQLTYSLIPGQYTYYIATGAGSTPSKKFEIEPGKTLDLGTLDITKQGDGPMTMGPTRF